MIYTTIFSVPPNQQQQPQQHEGLKTTKTKDVRTKQMYATIDRRYCELLTHPLSYKSKRAE